MNNKQWLDEIACRMNRAGLPADYILRTVVELSDHDEERAEYGECEADNANALTQTSASLLAAEFVGSFRMGRWFRRIPSLVWLLIPFPLAVFVCFGYYISGVVVLDFFDVGLESGHPSAVTIVLLVALFGLGKVLTPLIAGLFLAWALQNVGRPSWVFVCATAFLAFIFLSTTTDYSLPHRFSEGSVNLSIGDDWITNMHLCHWQVIQACVVLVTACGFGALKRRRLRDVVSG